MQRARSMVLALALVLGSSAAQADVIAPDVAACQSGKAGEACEVQGIGAGTCQASRCSRLDYSQGVPPSSVEYDCLKCLPKAAETGSAPKNDAAQNEAAKVETPKSSGCAVGSGASSTGLGGAVFFLLGFLGMRRRRVVALSQARFGAGGA